MFAGGPKKYSYATDSQWEFFGHQEEFMASPLHGNMNNIKNGEKLS